MSYSPNSYRSSPVDDQISKNERSVIDGSKKRTSDFLSRRSLQCKNTSECEKQLTSSTQYRNYLEEIELKIRYMKNDIEFKTDQINSKLKKSKNLEKLLTARNDLKSLATYNNLSSQIPKRPFIPGKQNLNEHKVAIYSESSVDDANQTKDTRQVIHPSLNFNSQPLHNSTHSHEIKSFTSQSAFISDASNCTSMPPAVHISNPRDASFASKYKLVKPTKNAISASLQLSNACQVSNGGDISPPKQASIDCSVQSKYNQNRFPSTNGAKVLPRFPNNSYKAVTSLSSKFQVTGGATSKYKLIQHKVTSNSSGQSTTSMMEAPNNVFGYCEAPNDVLRRHEPLSDGFMQIDSNSSVSGRKHQSIKHISKKHSASTVSTAAKLISKYKIRRLSSTSITGSSDLKENKGLSALKSSKLPRLTSLDHYNSGSSSKYKWQNAFKLDNREALRHRSKSKFNACGGFLNYQAVLRDHKKYNRYSRELRRTTQYKWLGGETVNYNNSTKANLRNTSSFYKWHRYPCPVPSTPLHSKQSLFQWQRLNNHVINLRSQIHKARLKHRLRLMMSSRSQDTRIPGKGCGSSTNVTDSSKGVGRLVMIGQMLYKASSKKLTRADSPYKFTSCDIGRKTATEKILSAGTFNSTVNKRLSLSDEASPHTLSSPAKKPLMSRKKTLPASFVVKNLRPQKMKLVTVRGVQFHLDSNGKKLSRVDDGGSCSKDDSSIARVDIGGMTYVKTGPGTLELLDKQRKLAASRAVQKSLSIVAARQKKTKKSHCLFFGRFGKCQRGNSCPFIHDQDKVVVCTRFLRGLCNASSSCPFSHEASVHKMPVCLYYLRGLCSRENCLYLHVKVSPDAPACKDFLHGFCAKGYMCKKLHSFLCPSYAFSGKCPHGSRCAMLHRKNNKKNHAGCDTKEKRNEKRPETIESKNQENPFLSKAVPLQLSFSSSPSSSSASSSSSVSSSTPSVSTYVIPSTDSLIGAQPSFISLASTTSGLNSQPNTSKQLQSESCSLVKATSITKTHEQLKITPHFLNSNSAKTPISMSVCENERNITSLHRNKKERSTRDAIATCTFKNNVPTTQMALVTNESPNVTVTASCLLSSTRLSTPVAPMWHSEKQKEKIDNCEHIPLSSSNTSTLMAGRDSASKQISTPNSTNSKSSPKNVDSKNVDSKNPVEDYLKFERIANDLESANKQQQPSTDSAEIKSVSERKDIVSLKNKNHNSLPPFKSTMFKGIIPSFMSSMVPVMKDDDEPVSKSGQHL